jgi:hypothetical protein
MKFEIICSTFCKKVHGGQCWQMVYFQTKNANLGRFGSVLQLNMLENFMDISTILLPFGVCI